jgi:hypothetical protein
MNRVFARSSHDMQAGWVHINGLELSIHEPATSVDQKMSQALGACCLPAVPVLDFIRGDRRYLRFSVEEANETFEVVIGASSETEAAEFASQAVVNVEPTSDCGEEN